MRPSFGPKSLKIILAFVKIWEFVDQCLSDSIFFSNAFSLKLPKVIGHTSAPPSTEKKSLDSPVEQGNLETP